MKNYAGVDIIIPVYNALDDLKLCFDSIIKYTDLEKNRVVFIEDKSTDENVLPYLKSIVRENVFLLENESNLGFSGSINRGISFSQRDVLLLNTDTIVTKNWIEKIVECAYSDRAIATVTPFSNNATLASVPNFCEENKIPYGLTIDEYAEVIERCSIKHYPKVTVAVGFCMFIKREVINVVGLFDKETFQKGYGEENDFCFRAEQLGYHHVLCDDTYIYHSGTVSFLSEEKKKLIRDHEKILLERYPLQVQKNSQYVNNNPHQYLRDNIEIYAKLKNGKKNVLYVLQADFRKDSSNNIGGTQFHVKDLVFGLKKKYNVFVAARDKDYLRLTAYIDTEKISFKFYIGNESDFVQFFNASIAEIFRNILNGFCIDIVHVHHTLGISFDIFYEAKKMNIPLFVTLHDYYYICPNVKLLENGNTYCKEKVPDCKNCIYKEFKYTKLNDYISHWRSQCTEVLKLCDVLITPSQAAKNIYLDYYPFLQEKIQVISHGMDFFESQLINEFSKNITDEIEFRIESAFQEGNILSGWAFVKELDSSLSEISIAMKDEKGNFEKYNVLVRHRPDVAQVTQNNLFMNSGFSFVVPDNAFDSENIELQIEVKNQNKCYFSEVITVSGYKKFEKKEKRVAFIGGLNESKGSQTAYNVIKQAGNRHEWYIFGGIGDAELYMLEKKNLKKTDWYTREDIAALLRGNLIDLVCILPIWPETFCYTLSEAVLAGIPVLATDIGALGERIKKDNIGWLVPYEATPAQILEKIDELLHDENALMEKKENLKKYQHKSLAAMNSEYDKLYESITLQDKKECEDFNRLAIYNAYAKCNTALKSIDINEDLSLKINEIELEINSIKSSIEYRMVNFISKKNIPFKRQFKSMLLFGYKVYKKLGGS